MNDNFLGSNLAPEEKPKESFGARPQPPIPSYDAYDEPRDEETPPFVPPQGAADPFFGDARPPELPVGRASEPELPAGGRDYLLPLSILVSGVLVAGSVLYAVGNRTLNSGGQTASGGNQQANLATAPAGNVMEIQNRDVILGDPKAPVTLVEYGDYQCPFCVRFHETTEPQIRNDYIRAGKLKMVFRNFQFLGPESQAAAEAAECAIDQNHFWAYHDALYNFKSKDTQENDGSLTRALFIQIATTLNMDVPAFTSCIDSHKYASQVQQDTQSAQTVAGVNSTPTLFLNGQKLLGALPYDNAAGAPGGQAMKPLIDQALAGK